MVLIASAAHAQARLDGIAALVGGATPGPGTRVILRSDVELRARLGLAGQSEQITPGPLPDALLVAVLDEIIGEELISREADRLRAAPPSDGEIARERERLIASSGGQERVDALLRAMDGSQAEIDAIARRRAYVAAFLRANLEGSAVIGDAQIDRVYESGNHPFVGHPLADVREPLRAWIVQRRVRRDVRRWVEVLRGRSTVRVIATWSH
jgi:hypothetical protein